MKALIWNEDNSVKLVECKEPEIKGSEEVKIKIKYAGICGTDLQVVNKNSEIPYNIVMGHEAVGEIVEIGNGVAHYKVGDMVIIDPNQYCGKCYYCKKGLTNFCEAEGGFKIAGINIDGTFGEYFVCEQRFLYKIPKDMDLLCAVLVEPLACVLNNIRTANVTDSDAVLVLGSGPMGTLCQIICKDKAKLVVGTENSAFRKEYCSQFNENIYSSDELTLDEVYRINADRKFDVIIDTVGTQLGNAIKLSANNARIMPMGMNKNYSCDVHPIELINKGIKIMGASEYNMLFIDTIETMKKYTDMHKVVTKKYRIEDYETAFREVLGHSLTENNKEEIKQLKVVFEF